MSDAQPVRTAGRELDRLIAEKVMDEPEYWSVRFGGSRYGDFKTLEAAEKCAKKIQGDFKASVQTYFDCPHYSTDIRAAWLVVEKLRAYGWQFACTLYNDKLPYASFCRGASNAHNAEAETMPQAISLAALKALKVK